MNPPSLHRYLYAYANPATYTDSTGRQVDIEDPSRAAWVLGWNDEQYRDAVAVDTAAREVSGGAFLGAGKQVAQSVYGVAKWGARVLAKTTLDVGDAKDIVDPLVNGVVGIVDAVRRGPNGFVEYEAHKSVESQGLIRQGRTIEAGELYGPEVAVAVGSVASASSRLGAFGTLQQVSVTIEGIVAEAGNGSVVMKAAPAAASPEVSIGPKIGRSGYESWSDFNAEAYRRYQQFTDDAYDVALAAEQDGLLPGNASTRIGDFVDRDTRFRMAEWLSREGIPEGPGNLVQLNRWLRSPRRFRGVCETRRSIAWAHHGCNRWPQNSRYLADHPQCCVLRWQAHDDCSPVATWRQLHGNPVQRSTLMQSIRNLSHLYDFIGYMVLRAPDRFPTEDFLEPDEQMTLDRGFQMLKASLVHVPVPTEFPAFHSVLGSILDASLMAYRGGDRKAGARKLLDFQDLIFEPNRDAGHP